MPGTGILLRSPERIKTWAEKGTMSSVVVLPRKLWLIREAEWWFYNFNIQQALILHILSLSPGSMLGCEPLVSHLMEVANTSRARRINTDSTGSTSLCKTRAEFNRRAGTGILHASTSGSRHRGRVCACSSSACRTISSRAKTLCPNGKLLLTFVISKTFWMIFDEKKYKNHKCYPVISPLHYNTWVQEWRKQCLAKSKQFPLQPRAALLLVWLEEQGSWLQQLSTPRACKLHSCEYTEVWVFLYHLYDLQSRLKISWEQELPWEDLNFRSGQKVSWISIPENISVILCWPQLEPVHADTAENQTIS